MIINRLDNNLLIEEGIFSILPSSSRTANKWLLIVLHRFEFFISTLKEWNQSEMIINRSIV